MLSFSLKTNPYEMISRNMDFTKNATLLIRLIKDKAIEVEIKNKGDLPEACALEV